MKRLLILNIIFLLCVSCEKKEDTYTYYITILQSDSNTQKTKGIMITRNKPIDNRINLTSFFLDICEKLDISSNNAVILSINKL